MAANVKLHLYFEIPMTHLLSKQCLDEEIIYTCVGKKSAA